MPLIRFSLNNPLIVNLSIFIILIAGVISWNLLPQEIFPVINLDIVNIKTEFEGASPIEVEQQLTLSIEEKFRDSQDIDYITSTSSEGLSNIYIRLKPGSNVDDFMGEARTILDVIDDLPESAEEPELNRIRTRFPVITLTLYGNLPAAELYKHAEKTRRRLQQIPGVASVSKAGVRDWEIWVEVDPHELSALGVSLEELTRALRNNLLDQPGGSIKSEEGDIRLRGKGAGAEPEQIEGIVLRTNADGGKLLVGDVARVLRRFEEPQTYARFNGKPSVNLTVTKTADASTIAVAGQVRGLADELKQTLPPSIRIGYHTDLSVYVKVRLNTVKSSGLIGLILVLLSLYLLLNFRVAAITAFGIPVAFLIAIISLYYLDYSINMVSLFAFLIVLGMIVDDAIIVTENVYRHIENGMPPFEAAKQGANEVLWPVLVSTLTSIAAFMPIFAVGGIMGAFIEVIAVVVCAALLGSLLEAFLVLPSHAGHILKKQPRGKNFVDWEAILSRYAKLLHWSALNRYFVAAVSIGALAISLSYAHTRLSSQLFGDIEIGQFFLNIETPNTYSLEDSLALAEEVETKLLATVQEDELDTMLTNIGISIIDFNRNKTGSNIIQVIVDLKKPVAEGFIENWITPLVSLDFNNFGPRQRSAEQIINQVREAMLNISGIQRLSILRPDAGPAGDDIEVGVVSSDLALIQTQADEIKNYLQRLPGVNDVVHDQEAGKIEYRYILNDRGRQLGVNQSQLATAVRNGFLGNKILYITWDEERVPVRIIYPELMRQRSDSLEELPIVLANNDTVYLGDVADISIDRGVNQIRRRDGRRMAKITANVNSDTITASEAIALVDKQYGRADNNGDYSLLYLGEKKNAEESFKGIKHALIIALALIFFMLTALFRSLIDPIVVMIVIPFGMIGVIIGHAAFGHNLQFLSAVGVLALSGIIVNDSLIMVDFIKKQRSQGIPRVESVVNAGRVRARPILLTTITTFLGVSPLIFFTTGQTAFLAPMAISLGFGLLFATALILLTLPCFYLIADDLRAKLSAVLTGITQKYAQ